MLRKVKHQDKKILILKKSTDWNFKNFVGALRILFLRFLEDDVYPDD